MFWTDVAIGGICWAMLGRQEHHGFHGFLVAAEPARAGGVGQ